MGTKSPPELKKRWSKQKAINQANQLERTVSNRNIRNFSLSRLIQKLRIRNI